MERNYMRNNKVKDKWDCQKFSFQGDPSCGLTWPPRNYNCTFCKREFRSAQALGGHMNVHRRDRARLRQLPSPVLEFQNPKLISNPNPSFPSSSLSSPPSKFLPFPYKPYKPLLSPSLTSFSSPSSASTDEENKHLLECPPVWDALTPRCEDMPKKLDMRADFGAGKLKDCGQKCDELDVFNKEENISLDLEMALKDPKEVLDLELRLGCF